MADSVVEFTIREGDEALTYNYSGQLIAARIQRGYVLSGITDLGGTNEKEVLNAAVAHVQANYVTPGSVHQITTSAKATGFRGVSMNSATAAMVIVTWSYDFGGIPTEYSVEVAGSLQSVIANYEYTDDTTITTLTVPYTVSWNKPSDPKPAGTQNIPGAVQVLRPVANIVITKSVSSAVAETLETNMATYVGTTNNAVFRTHAINTVLCTGVTTTLQPYNGIYMARLGFAYRPETWDEYARVTNSKFGTPPNIWPAKTGTGAHDANGLKKARVYPRTNHNSLLSLL